MTDASGGGYKKCIVLSCSFRSLHSLRAIAPNKSSYWSVHKLMIVNSVSVGESRRAIGTVGGTQNMSRTRVVRQGKMICVLRVFKRSGKLPQVGASKANDRIQRRFSAKVAGIPSPKKWGVCIDVSMRSCEHQGAAHINQTMVVELRNGKRSQTIKDRDRYLERDI